MNSFPLEQLKHTEQLAREADASADISHKSSKDLKKYNGWFAFRFPRFRKRSKKKEDVKYLEEQSKIEEEKDRLHHARMKKQQGLHKDDPLEQVVEDEDASLRNANADLSTDGKDRRYQENLEGIHDAVKNLKQMSLDMNDELEEQDVVLRSIDHKTVHTSETLERTNKNIRKFV